MRNSVNVSTLLIMIALTEAPGFCGDWNPRLAADYLDSRQKEWFAWGAAQATGGVCISCHTGMTYLLARPSLRRALGENQATAYEKGLSGAWAADSMNKRYEPDSMPACFMRDAATAFAALALLAPQSKN